MVLFLCRKNNPIIELVRFVMIMNCPRIGCLQIRGIIQLMSSAFLSVHSLPVFENDFPQLKLFVVLTTRFFLSLLFKWYFSKCLCYWIYQWLLLRKPWEKLGSSFRFSTGGLPKVVRSSYYCQELIEGVGWFLSDWQGFYTFLKKKFRSKNLVTVRC